MYLCLSATYSRNMIFDTGENSILFNSPAVLESFWYYQDWQEPYLKNVEFFMLDSGAFSMFGGKTNIDIDSYCDRYIEFINNHSWINRYVELDVESIFGMDKMLELRKRLERGTGKQCMPVMHRTRTKDDYLGMCKDYEYICFGDFVSKEQEVARRCAQWFIDTAHDNDCKIHGLGFTPTKELHKYDFDSVDSSSWLGGGRFGNLYHFNGISLDQINKPSNMLTEHYVKIDTNNFLCTDIMCEKYGKKYAIKSVCCALLASVASIIATQVALAYTPNSFDVVNDSMKVLFQFSLKSNIASFGLFLLSNVADILLYEKIKQKTDGKKMWIRNNVSTIICNGSENFIFYLIIFYGVYSLKETLMTAIGATVIEIICAICDTPFLYWATGNGGEKKCMN